MVWLIRFRGEKLPCGVVVASSIDELWDIVDEGWNPNEMMYSSGGAGGGMVHGFCYGRWDKRRRWRRFTDLCGGDFDAWYSKHYIGKGMKGKPDVN